MARKSPAKAARPEPASQREMPKAKAKTSPGNGPASPPDGDLRLIPKPSEVVVRMYRQGLGDCFLLAFGSTDPAPPCYVLVDCGVHARQDEGPDRMMDVMEDIVPATGGRIDVVVATHEHADHLSGFVQKGSPFLDGRLKVGQIWLAWTEKPGDPQADTLRRHRNAARDVIRRAVEKLNVTTKVDLSEQLVGLGDFEKLVGAAPELEQNRAEIVRKKGRRERPSTAEVALEMLVQKVGTANVRYCEPGKLGPELPCSNTVRVHVLGPPRDEALLKKDRPTGRPDGPSRETYLAGRSNHLAFVHAPGLDDGDPFGQTLRLDDDLRYPFDGFHRRKYRALEQPDVEPAPRPRLEGREYFRSYDNYFKHDAWRRIEIDWLGAAETLALDLDSDTNNTSLVLAFERGEPGQGGVLLFVGDAQVGNWLSWRRQTYTTREGTAQTADALLSRTVLYKVGHHGSHNGTVKLDSTASDGDRTFGLELMPSQLIALVPVDRAAARKPMPRPWHMPHPPLYRRLLQKASGRVLCSDGQSPEAESEILNGLRPVGPSSSEWSPVPGLSNCRWREAPQLFKHGETCALYYEISFRALE
jgi:hypothetical protein